MQTTKNVRCPLCHADTFAVLYLSTLKKTDFNPKVIQNNLKNSLDNFRKHSRIVKCHNCSFVYTNPQESFSSLLRGYRNVEDDEYIKTESYRKFVLKKHLSKITQIKKPGSVLDIGCFVGYFLELAKEKKWRAEGIEPSAWARKIAKKRHSVIIGSNIETHQLKKNHYDAVTLFDVIEHLPNPRKILKKIYTSLKKEGLIAIATPNIESFWAKFLGSKNPYLIRMHLLFFSPLTLTQLLEEEGFEVISESTYGRVFPLSYVVNRLSSGYSLLRFLKRIFPLFSFLENIPITLNLGDSFLMLARKRNEIDKKSLITVIVTAYNEEKTIKRVVKDIRKYLKGYHLEIIIVDDASTDSTKIIAKEAGADTVIVHKRNTGKGGAFKTGIKHSKGAYIIQIDADYQFLPREIPKLLSYLQSGYDVVLGSRYERQSHIDDESINHLRLYGSYFLSFAASVFANVRITDVMAGFKGFKAEVFKKVKLETNHFGYEAEVVIKASKHGYRIKNVPISYLRRVSGKSSLVPFKHGFLVLGSIVKASLE